MFTKRRAANRLVFDVATLANDALGERFTIGESCLVGRGPRCTLRLDDPLASSEHARLRWRGGRWYVRDLGSSNGTRIDDVALVAGQDHPLDEGSVLCFGNREVAWQLVDASAPLARACKGNSIVVISDGILALPDDDAPECQVFRDPYGTWVIERAGELEPVADQHQIELASGRWRLELPPADEVVDSTSEGPLVRLLDFEDITLRFTVSHDGEDVSLCVVMPGDEMDLGVRVYNDMLLELARCRLDEAAAHPELDAEEHGWLYNDGLIARAGLRDDSQLNQYVFHARRQLSRAGIDNAASLIERGRRGRLRLGTNRVELRTR